MYNIFLKNALLIVQSTFWN